MKKIFEALKIIVNSLKNEKFNWAIAGSTNLLLQGIKVKPRDIDLITTKQGAYKIEKILKDYKVEGIRFKESKKLAGYYGKFMIKNIPVEVIGEIRRKNLYLPYLKSRIFVEVNRMKIPCLSLEAEARGYKFLGRRKKYNLIKSFNRKVNN